MAETSATRPDESTPTFGSRADSYQERVEAEITRCLSAEPAASERLLDAMRYAALGPGKRIRPLLVYASSECLGVDVDIADAIAASVEMIHAYSLVHDDLPAMDDDDLRRGRPTVHVKFDEATAILVGDALQALAFAVLTDKTRFAARRDICADLVSRLATAAGTNGMAGGQALDIAYSGRSINREAIEQVFMLKTGRLIAASILMPMDCADGVDDEVRAALERFADLAGLRFQIQDDVLEATRSTEELGKPGGSDERNERSTYPAVLGLPAARARLEELSREAAACLDVLGERGEGLRWVSEYIVSRKF